MTVPSIFRGHPVRARHPFWTASPMEQLFEDVFRGFDAPLAAQGFEPAIDVEEDENEIRVTAELPGLEEKDFSVEVDGDVLKLSGEKRSERDEQGKGWHRTERGFGRFQRAFRFSSDVDATKVSARFKNGVLVIALPKAESAKPREIPVTSA